jgi:glycine/serine hydroxymethyltransferase
MGGSQYAEGYPGQRYYGGNENIDEVSARRPGQAPCTTGLVEVAWAAGGGAVLM